MSDFLIDTLIWTAAMIALVLILRRPVARHFGPQAAYALWVLPVLRLVLPPIELPAWLAPAAAPQTIAPIDSAVPALSETMIVMAPPVETPIDWAFWLVGAWLVGAVIFLTWRFAMYFRMRGILLADAKPVGETGRIRLVETPAANSPVAFGLFDRVIALPPGFMAWQNRTTRDLALAHEIAHHEGYDLFANFAVQPLFALHWFNPLGWYGWRAMRCDQEAACDARVLASCETEARAAYAEIIAGFAAGPNVALAAPMACPVLGEKSIIHRLRSMTMSDLSPRRRHLGRALVIAGALALPLTASITYAETAPAPPLPPAAPSAPGAVPAPPAPPAPPTPAAPPTPLALQAGVAAREDGAERDRVVIIRKSVDESEDGDGEGKVLRNFERRVILSDGKKLTEEDRAKLMAEIDEKLAEADVVRGKAEIERRVAMMAFRDGLGRLTEINLDCDGDGKRATGVGKGGRNTVIVCRSEIDAQTLSALKKARASIAKESVLEDEMREKILKSLDEKIDTWTRDN